MLPEVFHIIKSRWSKLPVSFRIANAHSEGDRADRVFFRSCDRPFTALWLYAALQCGTEQDRADATALVLAYAPTELGVTPEQHARLERATDRSDPAYQPRKRGRAPVADAERPLYVWVSQRHLDALDRIGPNRSAALRAILDGLDKPSE